jgi:hypothetical protein
MGAVPVAELLAAPEPSGDPQTSYEMKADTRAYLAERALIS